MEKTVKGISRQTYIRREKVIRCETFMSLEAEPALEFCRELQRVSGVIGERESSFKLCMRRVQKELTRVVPPNCSGHSVPCYCIRQ